MFKVLQCYAYLRFYREYLYPQLVLVGFLGSHSEHQSQCTRHVLDLGQLIRLLVRLDVDILVRSGHCLTWWMHLLWCKLWYFMNIVTLLEIVLYFFWSQYSTLYSLRVCQCSYDPSLIKAWENWDEKHGSENDHPKDFPEKQVFSCLFMWCLTCLHFALTSYYCAYLKHMTCEYVLDQKKTNFLNKIYYLQYKWVILERIWYDFRLLIMIDNFAFRATLCLCWNMGARILKALCFWILMRLGLYWLRWVANCSCNL